MAVYKTYDATGIREDLADIIYNISPTDTPFISNVGKGSTNGTYYEWQVDSLATAANNAQVEGADAPAAAASATTRVGNYTQIASKLLAFLVLTKPQMRQVALQKWPISLLKQVWN